MVRAILPVMLLLTGTAAHAERLVFTTMTHVSCPVRIEAPADSKDYGFQSIQFRNDSDKIIEKLYLSVVLSTGRQEEDPVDSGHIYVELAPGEAKRVDVFLGRIEALRQRIRGMHREVAWIKLSVTAAEFMDGSRWDTSGQSVDVPVAPAN